jgi:uncharacterized protein (TIGR03000 family)
MRSLGVWIVLGALSLILLPAAPSAGENPYSEDGPRKLSTRKAERDERIVRTALYDGYIEAEKLNVSVGTTVRWRNLGEGTHTVTSDSKKWGSDNLYPGEVFSYTFNRPGTYRYHCARHPKTMRGIVVVRGESGGRASAKLTSEPARRDGDAPEVPTADDVTVGSSLSTPPPHRAVIRVRLPDKWADVYFDGKKVGGVGTVRNYVTPELPEARTFEVTATWKQDGRSKHGEKSVTVEEGQVRTVDLTAGK